MGGCFERRHEDIRDFERRREGEVCVCMFVCVGKKGEKTENEGEE